MVKSVMASFITGDANLLLSCLPLLCLQSVGQKLVVANKYPLSRNIGILNLLDVVLLPSGVEISQAT